MRNNWDEEQIRELVDQISDRHFEEAARVRAGLEQAPESEGRGRGRFFGYVLAAACVLVLIGAATVNIFKNQEQDPAGIPRTTADGSLAASNNDEEPAKATAPESTEETADAEEPESTGEPESTEKPEMPRQMTAEDAKELCSLIYNRRQPAIVHEGDKGESYQNTPALLLPDDDHVFLTQSDLAAFTGTNITSGLWGMHYDIADTDAHIEVMGMGDGNIFQAILYRDSDGAQTDLLRDDNIVWDIDLFLKGVRRNTDGIQINRRLDECYVEENMLPRDPVFFDDWKFDDSLTAAWHEGIAQPVYENPYRVPFVTTRELKLYTEDYFTTGDDEDSIQVPTGIALTFAATDRTEWIYVEDVKGQYSGWLHFLTEDGCAYRVENGDQLYNLTSCFYSMSGEETFKWRGELGEPGIFEEELSEQPFALVTFNSQEELRAWLEEHDGELPETFKKDCRKVFDQWDIYVDSTVGDYPQIIICVYQDSRGTDFAYTELDWKLDRMIVWGFYDEEEVQNTLSAYYCIGIDHFTDKEEFRDFESLERIYVRAKKRN